MDVPVVGAPAPDFTLPTDAGKPLALASLRGKPVVLYFYPKDDTETCTKEACAFRDAFPRFRRLKAAVLGVSPDTVKSHARFRKKYALPFPLLADVEHAVAEAYGVWREKQLFGHRYMGVERTTFVIDAEGRVAHVFEKVRTAGHAEAVAKVVAGLG
ncbi:thioredoxin-dependent thiol peroxidase [Roseisolibacter sp. H3M3-2]|uniref:thioredoxin-dependent thiol peroxidase n=1 Tax=Roseisolibacter sp. H3M3-2 TaxID=3031323 RepID=UPI0023DBF4D2|nr:thioredoxin-dependent thiol peroxidase [Roseisolibacter sp. H3M3-2]MDF1501422.1 thioredoxin-dependent thiol peroxidase [Roseisolibacter sp. H3M3-2]